MRLILVDCYLMAIIGISICTGYSSLQLVMAILWFLSFCIIVIRATHRNISAFGLAVKVFATQLPAWILVLMVPLTPHFDIDGYTDGFLAIWETPFEPFLALLPSFRIHHFSGMFAEDCALPLFLVVWSLLVHSAVKAMRKRQTRTPNLVNSQ